MLGLMKPIFLISKRLNCVLNAKTDFLKFCVDEMIFENNDNLSSFTTRKIQLSLTGSYIIRRVFKETEKKIG